MATYRQIQNETNRRCGFVPKTCWIADVKAELGLISRAAANRIDAGQRKHPCPGRKRSCLIDVVQKPIAPCEIRWRGRLDRGERRLLA